MMRVSWLPLSLESPINEDEEDSELGNLLKTKLPPPQLQSTYAKLLREKIEEVLDTPAPARSAHSAAALWAGKWAQLHAWKKWARNSG